MSSFLITVSLIFMRNDRALTIARGIGVAKNVEVALIFPLNIETARESEV